MVLPKGMKFVIFQRQGQIFSPLILVAIFIGMESYDFIIPLLLISIEGILHRTEITIDNSLHKEERYFGIIKLRVRDIALSEKSYFEISEQTVFIETAETVYELSLHHSGNISSLALLPNKEMGYTLKDIFEKVLNRRCEINYKSN